MSLVQLNTAELIEYARKSEAPTELELELLSRLCDALEEVDALVAALEEDAPDT